MLLATHSRRQGPSPQAKAPYTTHAQLPPPAPWRKKVLPDVGLDARVLGGLLPCLDCAGDLRASENQALTTPPRCRSAWRSLAATWLRHGCRRPTNNSSICLHISSGELWAVNVAHCKVNPLSRSNDLLIKPSNGEGTFPIRRFSPVYP